MNKINILNLFFLILFACNTSTIVDSRNIKKSLKIELLPAVGASFVKNDEKNNNYKKIEYKDSIYYTFNNAFQLDESNIEVVSIESSYSNPNLYNIRIEVKEKSWKSLQAFMGKHIRKNIFIIVNGEILSAPYLQSVIYVSFELPYYIGNIEYIKDIFYNIYAVKK